MRIGIDARLAFGDATGLGTYTRRLVAALAQADDGNEYVLYTDRPPDAGCARSLGLDPERLPDAMRVAVVGRPGRRVLWTQGAWPRAAARDRVDLLHGIANFEAPLRFRGLVLATLHDLVPLERPETVPALHRWQFRWLTPAVLRRADAVVVPSAHTGRALAARYGPRETVEVIPNWPGPAFVPAASAPGTSSGVLERLGLRRPYLLFAGACEPKKNLERLLEAFARLAPTWPDVDLALAGAAGWGSSHLPDRVAALGLGGRVRRLGVLPEAELIEVLGRARALVFPSLDEGFGLPVVEAMACATPVVTSRAGALPEVGGDAVLYVDPLDVASIADGIARLLGDAALAARLADLGRARAASFSGERAAARLGELYLDLFNRP